MSKQQKVEMIRTAMGLAFLTLAILVAQLL